MIVLCPEAFEGLFGSKCASAQDSGHVALELTRVVGTHFHHYHDTTPWLSDDLDNRFKTLIKPVIEGIESTTRSDLSRITLSYYSIHAHSACVL